MIGESNPIGKNILVVEDDGMIGAHIQKLLAAWNYPLLEICTSGKGAVESVTRCQPDLILMDIELLGEMNGVEMARYLRTHFDIPIVYLTAYANDPLLHEVGSAEPYGYLVKPVQELELRATIELALYRHRMEKRLQESEERYRTMLEEQVKQRTAELNASNLELQQRTQELEALFLFSSSLRRALNLQAVADTLTAKTAEVFHADTVMLILAREDSFLVFSANGLSAPLSRQQYPLEFSPLRRVLQDGEALFYDHEDEQEKLAMVEQNAFCARIGCLHACAFVPLKTAAATIGLLHIGFCTPHRFRTEEQHLLSALAEMASNALNRAIAIEALEKSSKALEQSSKMLEKRVADRTRELLTSYRLSVLARDNLDLNIILERSLEEILSAMRCKMGVVQLLDETGSQLELVAQKGLPVDVIQQVAVQPANAGLSWWVMRSKAHLLLEEIEGEWRSVVNDAGVANYLGVPMRAVGRVIGVLSIFSEAEQKFTEEDVALLDSVSDHVAATIETVKLRSQTERLAISAERARLSRELHDSVTQSLYSLTLFAEAGRQVIQAEEAQDETAEAAAVPDARTKIERVKSYLDQIYEIAHQSLKEMRLLIYELRPPMLESEHLVGALHQRLDSVERRSGVEARLLVEDLVELPAMVEEELYRIVQEALNNVLKHANAKTLCVRLRIVDAQLELEITDDGVGFDPGVVATQGGMGLMGMAERAQRIEGDLFIVSTPGKGTQIKITAPINEGRRMNDES